MNPVIEIYYELENPEKRSHSKLPNIIRDKATAYVGLSDFTNIPMVMVNTHSFKFCIAIADLKILLAQPIVEKLFNQADQILFM